MSHLPRILLNAATVVSLAAGAAVIGLCYSDQPFYLGSGESWAYVAYGELELSVRGAGISVFVPLALVITAVAPTLWLERYRRRWAKCRRASRRGLCAACGYDPRATPERCPECGTATGR